MKNYDERREALVQALKGHEQETTEAVLERAEAFYGFLAGGEKAEEKVQPLTGDRQETAEGCCMSRGMGRCGASTSFRLTSTGQSQSHIDVCALHLPRAVTWWISYDGDDPIVNPIG